MSDISLKEDQAKIWIADVNDEIEQVKEVLNKVSVAISTVPTDDDVIFNGLRNVGQTLENTWGKLVNVFKEVGGILDGVIKKTVTAASELREQVDSLDRKYKS